MGKKKKLGYDYNYHWTTRKAKTDRGLATIVEIYPEVDYSKLSNVAPESAEFGEEVMGGYIEYPDGTIEYFGDPSYQTMVDYNNGIPVGSANNDNLRSWIIDVINDPTTIVDDKTQFNNAKKTISAIQGKAFGGIMNRFFANGGKQSRLRPKKFQPGGDIEDEINELPPYYNGTDTVPSTNTTNNNKYGMFSRNALARRNTNQSKLAPITGKTMTTGYKVPIGKEVFEQMLRANKYPNLKDILHVYKRGGNLAVKVDRGNGIEGYRSVSHKDVNWVRNADGRYVPLLKEFARGGMMRKFKPGGPVEDLGRGMSENDSIAITRLQRIYEAAYNKYNGANDNILTPDEMYDKLKEIHDSVVLLDTINAVNGRQDKKASHEYMKNFKKLNSGK